MKKAIMVNQRDLDEKVALSEYLVIVKHKDKNPINFKVAQYTYEDVFEFIKEKYENNLDKIEKVTIEFLRQIKMFRMVIIVGNNKVLIKVIEESDGTEGF